MPFAPLTGFFGTNSSGKSSILQFLMMMKQTVESHDRFRVLHTGDKNSYVDLGTFYDLIHNHEVPGQIDFLIEWRASKPVSYNSDKLAKFDEKYDFMFPRNMLKSTYKIAFKAKIEGNDNGIQLVDFTYAFDQSSFGVQRKKDSNSYEWIIDNYEAPSDLDLAESNIIKSYDLDLRWTGDFVFAFEELFKNTFYLGPLRDYPNRIYPWSGEKPQDVGTRGEWAIPALLASPSEVKDQVAKWLRKVGLVHSFELRPIAPKRSDFYEVMVRLSAQAAEVPITDVGFGVSQLLPVLVLCYYVPENAIIILEQPEIHLHPAVQANLADLFIDVIKTRNVQIILESHSEHLLRRLQRRIAEEELQPEQASLYFTSLQDGESKLEELDIDTFGNIRNWPQNFFGDEMGDLVAMAEAAMRRQMNGAKS
jgi:predicted ATPase